MARFKVDENLPHAVAGLLAAEGHDVTTVAEQDMTGCKDVPLHDVCRAEGRTILTLDRGFGNPWLHPTVGTPGIVVLRPGRQDARTVVALVRSLLTMLRTQSPKDALWIVEPGRVRIRRG